MDARDLLPLLGAVEAARDRFLFCGDDLAVMETCRREWREARYRFRGALADVWPRFEAAKCLPGYDKVIRLGMDRFR